MKTKIEVARITIDLPVNLQKKLKTIAAIKGLSMREIVIGAIEWQFKQQDYKSINLSVEKS